MINKKISVKIFFISIISSLFISIANANTINFASPYPPGTMQTNVIGEWAKKVNEYSNKELSVRVFPLSLLSASESSAGIRDGIADAGFIIMAYWPGDYAHSNMVNESAMQLNLYDQESLGGNGVFAFQGAMAEFILHNCEKCLEEYSSQNQVYTAGATTSNYSLLCRSEVTEASDMAGIRVRAGGSHWARWLIKFGATQVNMTINDIREAISQGVVDCTLAQPSDLVNLGLSEVVNHITIDLPGGVYAGVGGATFNKSRWRSLDLNQRTAILKAGAFLTAEIAWQSELQATEIIDDFQKQGGQLHHASNDFIQETKEFIENDMTELVSFYETRHGVNNGDAMLTKFNELLTKWIYLTKNIESSEELAEIYWNEIFSKVDASTYGL